MKDERSLCQATFLSNLTNNFFDSFILSTNPILTSVIMKKNPKDTQIFLFVIFHISIESIVIKKVTELRISNGKIMLYQAPYFTLKKKRTHPYVRIQFSHV